MIYGSVCSGIEAASVAWEPLGWKASFFSEIESFPSAVLSHRFPEVPNRGDMTKYQEWPNANLDVLVGGTPCQAFSVAGLREGLSDPRGNLMLTFAAIARKYRPRWLVWENVPGVFSSGDGRDFASLLAVLSGRGVVAPAGGWQNSGIVPGIEGAYGLAWRCLDAQYFGVAQRRRRVFVVGCLGDWRGAAAVLLELAGLRGDSAPSRNARKNASAGVGGSAQSDGVVGSLTCKTGRGGTADDLNGQLIANDVTAATLDASYIASGQRASQEGALVFDREDVAHALRGEGHDASEDGTGRGTPLTANEGHKYGGPMVDGNQIIAVNAAVSTEGSDVSPTLAGDHLGRISDTTPVIFEPRFARNGRGAPDEVAPPLKAENGSSGKGDGAPCVVVNMQGGKGGAGATENLSPTLGADTQMHGVTVPFFEVSGACHTMMENYGAFTGDNNETRLVGVEGDDIAFSGIDNGRDATAGGTPTLRKGGDGAYGQARGLKVRRLTPRECERLQGFPDDWTLIPKKGGGDAADGPRYKAIGNSMAVPVMRWIGQRIDVVNAIMAGQLDLPLEAVADLDARVGPLFDDADVHVDEPYVLRTHNLHDDEKGDVWFSDKPGALQATGSTPNQFDAVVYQAEELHADLDGFTGDPGDVQVETDFLCMRLGRATISPRCGKQCDDCKLVEGEFEAESRDRAEAVERETVNATTQDSSEKGGQTVPMVAAAPADVAPGRCAKLHVTCTIITHDKRTVVGSNECVNPQSTCPRAPGEDYTKCKTICHQRGHAEVVALEMAREKGLDLSNAVAVLAGHYYVCEPCARALRDAGFARIQICL